MTNSHPTVADRADDVGAHVDVVIVGAGIAGLYAIHTLRGAGHTVRCFEGEAEVGGTWYRNRYPGARCDVESLDYSYSFSPELQQEWVWSERYATQPEILSYLVHVSERFDLRRSIDFETRVVSAEYDDAAALWHVTTSRGERVTARHCVLAVGSLSEAIVPDIPGIRDFAGSTYFTTDWPAEGVDFTGKRVGVIGTGSSGIQCIPLIAAQAQQTWVFQRTPNFSIPVSSPELSPADLEGEKSAYDERRRQSWESRNGQPFQGTSEESALLVAPDFRTEMYERFWKQGGVQFNKVFADQMTSMTSNQLAAEFVRRKIREQVADAEVAERLCPQDYPLGAKRICTDSGYYRTFNRPGVRLVSLKETPIERVEGSSVITSEGSVELDCLVLATGFDAMTGAFLKIDVHGRDGLTLAEAWRDGPQTYLGVMVHGFPNLYLINGPGSPSVMTNMVLGSEQAVNWVADCVAWMDETGNRAIDPTPASQEAWVTHVNDVASQTLFPMARSWYIGANIPGKPQMFMPYVGGFAAYGRIVKQIADDSYRGFAVTAGSAASAASDTSARTAVNA